MAMPRPSPRLAPVISTTGMSGHRGAISWKAPRAAKRREVEDGGRTDGGPDGGGGEARLRPRPSTVRRRRARRQARAANERRPTVTNDRPAARHSRPAVQKASVYSPVASGPIRRRARPARRPPGGSRRSSRTSRRCSRARTHPRSGARLAAPWRSSPDRRTRRTSPAPTSPRRACRAAPAATGHAASSSRAAGAGSRSDRSASPEAIVPAMSNSPIIASRRADRLDGMPTSWQAAMRCVPIRPLVLAPQMKKVAASSQNAGDRAPRARAASGASAGGVPVADAGGAVARQPEVLGPVAHEDRDDDEHHRRGWRRRARSPRASRAT